MKRVLIVAPHFPPVDAADMHRARLSAPHFASFGWQPFVLTVAPECLEMPVEARLLDTLPPGLPVTRTGALPVRWTRPLGVGTVGLRALAPLYRAGARIIARESIDLVYFSTTVFPAMALGRLWKRRFGVPYVLDIQDAWLSDYYDDKPRSQRPPKYRWARALHATLEPFAMRKVDGLIAVSPAYLETLRRRYPWITDDMCRTVPFGATPEDFDLAASLAPPAPSRRDDAIHGVSVGRGGDDTRVAATILFRALREVDRLASRPIDLSFVGTDYAPAHLARKTLAPIAEAEGVGALVSETPVRVPYFDGLRRLRGADFLVLLGSDDPQYSPSKVYPYLLAKRPIVAVLHASSPVVGVLSRADAGVVVTFQDERDVPAVALALSARMNRLVPRLPFEPETDPSALEPYSARELTRQQCEMFDALVRQRPAAVEVPCPG
jgi:Glycosyl transferase 4-like domain